MSLLHSVFAHFQIVSVLSHPQQQQKEFFRKCKVSIISNGNIVGAPGHFSKVYKGFYRDAERYFAIKVTDLESVSASFRQNFLPRELRIWRELNHPNHVYLYKDFMKSGYVFEIMELAVGGNMLTYVQERGPIAEMACREWMLQLIDALVYLHRNQIAHRDLKLENILIFDGGVIKISDYGFSKKSVDLSSTFCGSRSYVAPEILQGIEHDMFKVDIWSLGVIGFIMLTNTMPFYEDTGNAQIVDAQRRRQYSFPSRLGLSRLCVRAINILMTFEPRVRPSIFNWFIYGAMQQRSLHKINYCRCGGSCTWLRSTECERRPC
uniref:Protein kinase domain-containing protein n=1 Tax=Globodera pallida TaxID=36090 RepID=A0A183BWW7_GLOPA